MSGLLGSISGQIRLDVRQAVGAYALIRAQNAKTVYALRGTGNSFVSTGTRLGVAGGLMVGAFAKVVDASAEFEKRMDYASAVTGATGDEMKQLSDYALKLGQDTIYSANQIADGFVELAKAGVSTKDIINGVGEAMANLGAAGDIPLAQSGQIITSTIQQFSLSAKDAVRVTDLLAGAANASIADIDDLGVSLKYAGGVANAAGLDFQDTITAISLLAKAGIRGSTAGTSLRQMIVSFSGATKPAQAALKQLNIITKDGSNKFYDMQGNLKPLPQVFQILHDSLKGYNSETKLSLLRTIFNNRALSAAAILTRDGAKGFKNMYGEMGKVTAAEVAHKRLDNLKGDIEILQGNIETYLIKAGTPFQKTLRSLVQGLTKLIQVFGELPANVQQGILTFLAIGGVALLLIGSFLVIVGTILKFISTLIELNAGIKATSKALGLLTAGGEGLGFFGLLGGIIRGVIAVVIAFGEALIAAGAAIVGAVGAPVLIVIGIIAALIAAFVLAYKKITPFREFINSIGRAFMNGIVKPIGAAIGKVIGYFKSLGDSPGEILGNLASDVGSLIGKIVGFFLSLPGRILGAIGSLFSKIASLFTFQNLITVISAGIRGIIFLFIGLPIKILGIVTGFIASMAQKFGQLAPIIAGKIGYMIGYAIGAMIRFGIEMGKKTAQAVANVISWLRTLPARAAVFLTGLVVRAFNAMKNFAVTVRRAGPVVIAAIVQWLKQLPGKVVAFMVLLVAKVRAFIPKAASAAARLAAGVFKAIRDGIKGLPREAVKIVGNVIGAIKDAITGAFDAAKKFGSGLLHGFKDGIDSHSPSAIERIAWQMVDNVVKSAHDLKDQVAVIQKTGARLASSDFGMKDQILTLAQTRAFSAQVSGEAQLAVARGVDKAVAVTLTTPNGVQQIQGTLEIRNGQAYVSGIAGQTYDNRVATEATHTRMGRMPRS